VLAVQEWAAQCHGADTGLTAQRSTLAGMDLPRELVEQHRGVIPRRVRVVVRPCGVRALDAHTREWEQVRASALERGGPRPRGCFAVLPWWAAGATMVTIVLCACYRFEVSSRFAFFAGFKRDSPGCLGDPCGCPRHTVKIVSTCNKSGLLPQNNAREYDPEKQFDEL
jgi:hypothetical protein